MFQDTLTSLVCPYWTGNEGREIGKGLIFFFNPFVSYGVSKCCSTASAGASRDGGSSVQTPRYCPNSRALLLFHHLWMGAEPLRSPEWANLPKMCRAGAQLTCQPFA